MQVLADRTAPHSRVEPLVATAIACVFYAATCARDIQWGDAAKLTIFTWKLNLSLEQEAHLGALLWAWPFVRLPFATVAFRAALASAAASALTIGLLHDLLLKRCRNVWAARIATASLLVSHTFWFVTAIPESYPVSLLAIVVAWRLILKGRAAAAGVVLGAGAIANAMTLLSVPAAVWLLLRKRGRAAPVRLVACIGVAVAAVVALVNTVQPIPASQVAAVWARVARSYIDWHLAGVNVPLLLAYAAFNFCGPAAALIWRGVRTAGRQEQLVLLLFAAAHYAVAIAYAPQRAYLIPIPVYLSAALLVAAGADDVLRRQPAAAGPLLVSSVTAPLLTYAIAGSAIAGHLPAVVRDAPFRDEAAFYMRPWKQNERSARRYLEALDASIPDGALVLGDFTLLEPLLYAHRVEGWKHRCDFDLVDGRSPASLIAEIGISLGQGRRVFLLDDQPYYFRREIAAQWAMVAIGVDAVVEVQQRTSR